MYYACRSVQTDHYLKSVSKNRLQHWHSHCDFGMNILANYYFILQISHAKTFLK